MRIKKHLLEERDHKPRTLDDSDVESGSRLRTISLVPEDDQESTRTADTTKRGDWGATKPQGWRDESSVGDQDRRAVTFSPPPPEARPRTGESEIDHDEGTFVSYLGTTNVRVLHSSNRDPVHTP
ncbi:hypothetical protein RSAG8_04378, partial [Rhizoctonia solani AG-8 WAC10335]